MRSSHNSFFFSSSDNMPTISEFGSRLWKGEESVLNFIVDLHKIIDKNAFDHYPDEIKGFASFAIDPDKIEGFS